MSRPSCVVAVCLLTVAASPARGEDLATLLAGATAGTRPTAAVRGDGTLTSVSPDGTTQARVAVLQQPSGDLYFEVQPPGTRALLLANGAAWLSPKAGASAVAFAKDAALAGSEFSREDLQPFDAARYGSPTIVDRSPAETTVQLDPRDSQYTLVVVTFDREKQVPVKVMSYKDTLSHLLRMRRERGHQQIAGRWLPTEIAIENFPMQVTSTLTLQWRTTEAPPARFDPKTFATAPPLLP
ncbi:outer membrane lipoprotein-sorting protein [bacterium]|nr:outer membrane lipoprotein-sorting protein [bacterium]